MLTDTLNGWTADRLDDLARDVEDIRKVLERMQSNQVMQLQGRVKELERRPQVLLLGLVVPLLAAVIVVVLSHVIG